MLFELDAKNQNIEDVSRVRLKEFGWDERMFQNLLFDHLDKVIQDEDLLLIAQSRLWQEEPDLMGVDERGDLWIFEIKAWESEESNILQALRYGQKYGQFDYEQLNNLYRDKHSEDLIKAFQRHFPDRKVVEDEFNRNQHFIILTNGLDFRTRQAILFWHGGNRNLDVKPWIYRIYRTRNNELYLEFNTFRPTDNPYEDIMEDYFLVNTNITHDPRDDNEMLTQKKAAAFFDTKERIKKIQPGNHVFLYRSGEGIVARGIARSRYKKRAYHDNPNEANEEYYVPLKNFLKCSGTVSHVDILSITGNKYRVSTCIGIDQESGAKIWKEISQREKTK